MADVLSQNQIDDLLKSFSDGGEKAIEEIDKQQKENRTKIYDFRMPKKFTKERLRILDRIFENYARLLSSYFTGLLRIYCKVNLLQIEEQRYSEFNNALPEYVLMSIIDMTVDNEDINDTIMIQQMSNPITFTMMDRLLGGNGAYIDVSRDFTEIEIELMTKILDKMCELQKQSWATFIDINPVLTSVETNSRVVQSIAPDDVVILVIFEVEIKNMKNQISLCIPAINLEEMMNMFQEKTTRSTKRFDQNKDNERKNSIMASLKETPIDVTALLCETEVDLQDILNLQVNDIIPLNISIEDNVVVKIGGSKWFDGKLGAKSNRKAIKIDNVFKN